MKNFLFVTIFFGIIVVNASKKVTKFQGKQRSMTIDDDYCFDFDLGPDFFAPYDGDCTRYWTCEEDGAIDYQCPEGQIFDTVELFCGEPGDAICDFEDFFPEEPNPPDNPNPPDFDEECPLDTSEIRFIPGEFCDEYYICINGRPVLFECRLGQHWNNEKQYCDEPHIAGCDPSAHPPITPDCPESMIGTSLPHRGNCNWFWFCDRGNRSLQQCQHLFHFDIDQKKCVFMNRAKCVKNT